MPGGECVPAVSRVYGGWWQGPWAAEGWATEGLPMPGQLSLFDVFAVNGVVVKFIYPDWAR